jgi:hypothetical protein
MVHPSALQSGTRQRRKHISGTQLVKFTLGPATKSCSTSQLCYILAVLDETPAKTRERDGKKDSVWYSVRSQMKTGETEI